MCPLLARRTQGSGALHHLLVGRRHGACLHTFRDDQPKRALPQRLRARGCLDARVPAAHGLCRIRGAFLGRGVSRPGDLRPGAGSQHTRAQDPQARLQGRTERPCRCPPRASCRRAHPGLRAPVACQCRRGFRVCVEGAFGLARRRLGGVQDRSPRPHRRPDVLAAVRRGACAWQGLVYASRIGQARERRDGGHHACRT